MNAIFNGDCLEIMKGMTARSVQMCVTSPPYWNMRDYEEEGQLGLENTPEEYIEKLRDIFEEVHRVLADDGTLWLNLGDSYARMARIKVEGVKEKNLLGIPWRVALALQADDWYLRQDIIWAKGVSGDACKFGWSGAVMPESVSDRCTKSHEYLFLMAKRSDYFYDNEAIKDLNSDPDRVNFAVGESAFFPMLPADKNRVRNSGLKKYHEGERCQGRNRRSVWTVQTQPYAGHHFATFPQALVEPCILAGTSEKGHCPVCGARWRREVQSKRIRRYELPHGDPRRQPGVNSREDVGYTENVTVGWKASCGCGKEPVPDVVFDPFGGSGTTAIAARQLRRDWLLIELNKKYVEMAQNRIKKESIRIAIEEKMTPIYIKDFLV